MLGGRFDLRFGATGEVVRDVEALARGVLGVERWPAGLEQADNDELLAFLLGEAVVLERRYDRRDGIQARPWLFQRLRWRSRDWRDAFYRGDVVELDLGPLASDDNASDDRPDAGRNLDRRARVWGGVAGGAPGASPGDRGDARPDALGRLLEGGNREVLREIEALGLGPPPRARGRIEGEDPGPPGPDPEPGLEPWLDCRSCGWRNFLQSPNGEPGYHFDRACTSCGGRLELGWPA
jgi:hypothetical protein